MTRGEMAQAYDAIADDYDAQLEGDLWMRKRLWAHYARIFRPGQQLLDVGCGTGIDSLFLAQQGIKVTGIDVSPGMIAQLREKAEARGLTGLVETRVMDFAGLDSWPTESFDAVISAFAALNSVTDLAPFAQTAARLLRPEGRLVVHMLNRFSLWEWLGLLRKRRWREAAALGRQDERTFVVGGVRLGHHLFSAEEAYRRFFEPHFILKGRYGLGSLRPPHTVRRIPGVITEALGILDGWAGPHYPVANWGRFFVLEMAPRRGASR